MKKIFATRILATLLAFSLVVPAFAANYIAEVQMSGQTRDEITDTQRYEDLQAAIDAGNEGSTVYLLTDHTVTLSSYAGVLIAKDGQTLDLDNHTLTVESDSSGIVVGVSNNNKVSTIQNGTIVVDAPNANAVMGIVAGQGDVTLNNLTVEHGEKTSFEVGGAILNGQHDMTITDCVVLDGQVTSTNGGTVTVDSGVYGELGNGVKVTGEDKTNDYFPSTPGEGDEPGTGEPSKKGPTVIISDKTAAVVVDAEGNVRTYSDLNKAADKVGPGATVNVIGNQTAPDGFKVENGKLVEDKKDDTQGGGNQGGTTTPTYPIDPGFPGPGLMSIDDPEVPLAGLVTVADVLEELYKHEGSPNGEDADGETTKAVAWAIANDLIDEETDVEEIVTVAILRDVLTKYVDFAEISYTVKLAGEDDDIVDNCGEILTDLFAAD